MLRKNMRTSYILTRQSNNDTLENRIETAIIHGDNEDSNQIKEVMLTTSDNPFNPFTDFDLWFRFDSSMNYFSCNYLARIAKISDELSEADNAAAIERAIDEIVQLNLRGNYMKVQRIVSA